MKHEYSPRSLSIKAFAQAAGDLESNLPLSDFERLR